MIKYYLQILVQVLDHIWNQSLGQLTNHAQILLFTCALQYKGIDQILQLASIKYEWFRPNSLELMRYSKDYKLNFWPAQDSNAQPSKIRRIVVAGWLPVWVNVQFFCLNIAFFV